MKLTFKKIQYNLSNFFNCQIWVIFKKRLHLPNFPKSLSRNKLYPCSLWSSWAIKFWRSTVEKLGLSSSAVAETPSTSGTFITFKKISKTGQYVNCLYGLLYITGQMFWDSSASTFKKIFLGSRDPYCWYTWSMESLLQGKGLYN
jgi:hypothetical protein